MQIGTQPTALLRSLMPFQGLWYWTADGGAGAWVDDLNAFPQMKLILDAFP